MRTGPLPEPTAPQKGGLPVRKLLRKFNSFPPARFLRDGVMIYFNLRIPQSAACLAYFVLLAVFPVLICVSYLLGLANIDITNIINQLQPILPVEALVVIKSYLMYVSYRQTPGLFIAGLAACWFSAAAAYRTIARVILDVYDYVPRSPLRSLAVSILFPPALLLTLDLSVIVVVTGEKTLQAIVDRLPFLGSVLDLWNWLRYVLLFAIFFLFILAVLIMASPRGSPRTPMMVSSLTATLALVAASGFFSWFIGMSSRYSLIYGSLVSIVVLLIWLYLCGQILFLAIVFTSVWYKKRRRSH